MSIICQTETHSGANDPNLEMVGGIPKPHQIPDDQMNGFWDPLMVDERTDGPSEEGSKNTDNMDVDSMGVHDGDDEDALKEWEKLDLKNTGFKFGTPPVSITPSRTPRPEFGLVLSNRSELLARKPISQDAGSPALRVKGKKKRRGNKKAISGQAASRGLTPAPSGDESSDYSRTSSIVFSPRISALSGNGSARPSSAAGVSALKLQLDALNLGSNPGSRSASRTRSKLGSNSPGSMSARSDFSSDPDQSEIISYEVPLEHDFISAEAQQEDALPGQTGDQLQSSMHRKMTAADFTPLKCLGKGTYGTVLLVRQAVSGRLYAQKQFRKASLTVHKKLVEQTKTERTILESVNRHPFVVKLYYAFQDHEKLYLILEYAQGGELFTHLAAERMFSEDVAAFYMAELILALEHLHHNIGVVYRDLKPENCLLDSEGHLLLTDFGLSKVALSGEDRCNSSLGTIEYMAPEVVLGKPYGKACDWWSLGALGFDLLTGSSPFQANNITKIQEKILKQKLQLPYYLSPDAKDLLTRLLRKEPNKRLGYHMPKDLQIIKKHRFFRKIDWKALERREAEPPIKPFITDPELAENFASEFTDLGLSPVVTRDLSRDWDGRGGSGEFGPGFEEGAYRAGVGEESNPFGGFSFVASASLLDSGMMEIGMGRGEDSDGDEGGIDDGN
jgi:serine/threonine protein kinase